MDQRPLQFGDYIGGIDYSMSSPCLCMHPLVESKHFSFDNCKIIFLAQTLKHIDTFCGDVCKGIEYPQYTTDIQRYKKLSDIMLKNIIKNRVRFVCLEGYSFGSKGKVFEIGENTGILKLGLEMTKIKYEILAPTVVKKYATTKGNADKEKMYEAFLNETKRDIQQEISPKSKKISSPVSDIVDAYFICKHAFETTLVKIGVQ